MKGKCRNVREEYFGRFESPFTEDKGTCWRTFEIAVNDLLSRGV